MQQYPERRDQLPKPLEGVARELERASSERSDVLAADLKAKQRAMLIAHAERMSMPSTHSPEPVKQVQAPSRSPWFAWGGFALAGALAVIALFVSTTKLPGTDSTIRALAIPAAHAQDAFSVMAEQKDAQGVKLDSAFTIDTKVDVKQQDLKNALTIVPPIQYDLEQSSNSQFRIVPKEPLVEGEVYKVNIATVVGDTTQVKRDFSWALQATERFKVVRSTPATAAGYTPINTAIEFTFSQSGVSAPEGSQFTIVPEVKGKFDIRGRNLAFVPEKPLEYGKIYTVTLAKGFSVPGAEKGLEQDYVIRFETIQKPQAEDTSAYINTNEYLTVSSAKPVQLPVHFSRGEFSKAAITVYDISTDTAKSLIAKRFEVPEFAVVTKSDNEKYEKAEKTKKLTASLTIDSVNEFERSLTLPALEKGRYLVSVTPESKVKNETSWVLLQITDTAVYSVVDRNGIYVWAVNAVTNQVLASSPVQKNNERVLTDAQGLAKMSTPSVFNEPRKIYDPAPFVILTVGEGKDTTLIALQPNTYGIYTFSRPGFVQNAHQRSMAFVKADRSLYRMADSLSLYGLARDRDEKRAIEKVMVRLTRGADFWDQRVGSTKVYQTKEVETDSTGRFNAEMNWKELAPGYYQVEVLREGDEMIASTGFTVQEFIKPTFTVEVTPENDDYLNSETVVAQLRATFFDGTPMVNTSFKVDSENPDLTYHGTVKTDDQGRATVRIPSTNTTCPEVHPTAYVYCSDTSWNYVYIRPDTGEEANQDAGFTVNLHRSMLGMEVNYENEKGKGKVIVNTYKKDFDANDFGRSSKISQVVNVKIYPVYQERIENGTGYDPINKTTYPIYRYEDRSDAPIIQTLTTDDKGKGELSFDIRDDRTYRIFAESTYEGRYSRSQVTGFPFRYRQTWASPSSVEDYPEIALREPQKKYFINGEMQNVGYALNEEIQATYNLGKTPLEVSKTPGIFAIVASRGIIKTEVVNSPEYRFRLEERLTPTAKLILVTFRNGSFESVRTDVSYAKAQHEIEFEVKPEKDQYAPRSQVTVEVVAKNKQTGERVSDVLIGYSAIDKALIALGGSSYADPLSAMYSWVPDEILIEAQTHQKTVIYGGAEMGGAGSEFMKADARTNQKDVAITGTVRTDEQGVARITFTAPDNITTWQLDVAGVSDRLDAGTGSGDIRVTKPVFVDAVIPQDILLKDRPTMKLRAFGVGLEQGQEVSFEVDAPTLGIQKQVYKGKAGESLTLAIEKLAPGKHEILIGVTTAKGSDAIVKTISIEPTRVKRFSVENVEASPGAALPTATEAESVVRFMSKGKGQWLEQVYGLSWLTPSRADAALVNRLAAQWLRTDFGVTNGIATDEELQKQFSEYLDETGGIRLKAYGSTDVELTSEIAATAPELLDRAKVASYFWSVVDSKDSARVEQIYALAGLAALGEPVVVDLERVLTVTDLTVSERIALARGMEAAGNRESARGLLESLMSEVKTQDTVSYIEAKEKRDAIEYTADLAALATVLADPRAESLTRYITTNWTDDSFPVLAKARVIKAKLATAYGKDIVFKYVLGAGQSEQELVFNATQSAHELRLTREEQNNFRVTSVNGPVEMIVVRTIQERPASVEGLSVSRTIQKWEAGKAAPLTTLTEGDLVKISLTVSWSGTQQDGCYTVTDFLPGNMRAYHRYGDLFGYYLFKGGSVSSEFIACKQEKPVTLEYMARVFARGTYVAEAPLVQHSEYALIAASGNEDTIEVK